MEVLGLLLDEADERLAGDWSSLLDEDELARAARFHRAADRVRFVAAHALLRTALARATGVAAPSLRFAFGAHGKPFLPAAPNLHFSLTHTAGLAAVALHDHPVGCDAEPVARRVTESVFRMMAAEEAAWLHRLERSEERQNAFLRLWVVKEAYCKALGLGLSLPPDSYAFDLSTGEVLLRRPPADAAAGDAWTFGLENVGGTHLFAVAAEGSAHVPAMRLLRAENLSG